MIYYDKNKYPCIFKEEDVHKIEKQFNIQCLFGGIVASRAFGANNRFSDYDFIFVYKNKSKITYYDNIKYSINPSVDFTCFDLEEIDRVNTCSLKHIREFPTFYTENRRMPGEDQVVDFFRIFSSDYLWDSGYLKERKLEIEKKINPALILDFLFSRIAGNLENALSLDIVPTKAVIRTMYNLNCMLWILENHTYPYLNLEQMIKNFHFGKERIKMLNILKYHKEYSDRNSQSLICNDKLLNKYIEMFLKKIEKDIHNINFELFTIKTDCRSFFSKYI